MDLAPPERVCLTLPHTLPEGQRIVDYPIAEIDLAAEVTRLLIEKRFISAPVPLSDLHLHVKPADQALDDNYLNGPNRAFYIFDDRVLQKYRALIRHLCATRCIVDGDFVFQKRPIFRFHFPVPFPPKLRTESGLALQHHSDTLGGHPFEMYNAWLPLTPCQGTSALQISSAEDGARLLDDFARTFDHDYRTYCDSLDRFYRHRDEDLDFQARLAASCRPISMQPGQVLFFDPRCVHGGTENRELHTRVSMDFRIMPLAAYEALRESPRGHHSPRFSRGNIFAEETASQL